MYKPDDALRRVKIYALARASNPPAYQFIDRSDDTINITPLDWDGNYLDGGKTYKLSVPQPVPQTLFWSIKEGQWIKTSG